MKISQYLEKLNKIQRTIMGTVVSLLIIMTLAHNPFSGYTINYIYYEQPIGCSEDTKKRDLLFQENYFKNDERGRKELEEWQRLRVSFREEQNSLDYLVNIKVEAMCAQTIKYSKEIITLLPINEWVSDSPLIPWLGSVIHFIYSLVSVISIGMVFIYFVFSDNFKGTD